MRSDEGARPSLWDETADVPAYPPLTDALEVVDVCVIGAGIAGLTTAYHLARAGRRVVVLDDGPVGGGETGRTTAHLATAFDDYYHEVERLFGRDKARLLAESFVAGVDAIERIVREEGIDCDFRRLDGWWFPAEGSGDTEALDLLRKEERAARRLGLADVEIVADWPLGGRLGRPALRFPRQGQFHIHRYMAGLARAVERHGGRIFSGAHVTGIEDAPGEGAPCTVTTDRGASVRAADVVVAANTAINDRYAMHTKQAPYRTYVVTLRLTGDVPLALYWDTAEPYHYVRRLAAGDANGGTGDLLLVGGEDHKTGQSDDEPAAFDRLEAWARARFPVGEVVARWSGQVLEPVDYVAFIGRDPTSKRVWLVTGDSGNGMTHGTIAGLLLPALIAGEAHPWQALYDPSRITVGAATEWLRENLNVGAQYADYVAPGEVRSADEIPHGEGRILSRGVEKLAVYRGEDGALSVRSAVCPHLFCIVDWNAAERTWDCPCHGSRFGTDGHVINGPSKAPLKEASLD